MRSLGYGYAEVFHEETGKLLVLGWLLHLDGAFDKFEVEFSDGRRLPAERVDRPELAVALPHVPGSGHGGFRAEIPLQEIGPSGQVEFHLHGFRNGEPKGCMFIGYHRSRSPQAYPPSDVMKRATGNEGQIFWRATGIKNAHDMLRSLDPFIARDRIDHLLEWGCGSGRLTTHLIELLPHASISGTDIDTEAVQWAGSHLAGTFKPCQTEPPLPFADAEFDVIVSLSVMSHLTQHYQVLWLKELERVLKPGGLISISTHGAYAASWLFPKDCERLLASGFYDEIQDPGLGHVAGVDYYRATFQTYEFTRPFWGKYFDVLDFVEGGMSNLQDIYVLRKRGD